MRLGIWRLLTIFALVGLALPSIAAADSPKPEKLPEAVVVQSYGEKNPACLEWSDGCVICVRGGQCSTPGIACQPGEISCAKPAK
jgi:hypothetical protein